MNKEVRNIAIWGREFPMKIIYDVYSEEEILDSQKQALQHFLEKSKELLSNPSEIAEYCIAQNQEEIGASVDNIFKYVMPVSVFVARKSDKRVVAVLCNYRFDIEHGLAIVYENELLKDIGPQDIIL